ncbi:hypothetical protein G6F57_010581 [Rhizopus arrhizus]|uniref:Uridine kinase n=1 Tax=Rhizopus oryzae TaxID=64495 RepID=A0A9P6X1E4_RHIOR|nr:hypothetical protein G6F24_010561 [Rhizopus arrhizus]KAG0932231.1 hypothetical protein G6F30_010834 [Rhizopus arrhizus]KAG0975714.1 hypothetical protein G6F29_011331 [Rhizopus arrhizus]KAG0990899.1 hypothetical protein G6F28_009100 [Rhizopus arrhizus]KAG1003109.1 hypothetical protein G6F27_011351 [Rhizopus arrhizus]
MINPRVFFDIDVDGNRIGRIVIELFADQVPKTAENFRALCTGEKGIGKVSNMPLHYKGSIFHRIIKGFMCQGGDFTHRTGKGGESIYGANFPDESFSRKHDTHGLLSMANRGPNTQTSQFFITTRPTPHLDGKHVVFGRVVSGYNVVEMMENEPVDDQDRPLHNVMIANCGELVLKLPPGALLKKASVVSDESEDEIKDRKRSRSSDDDSGSDDDSEEEERKRTKKKRSRKHSKKDKKKKKRESSNRKKSPEANRHVSRERRDISREKRDASRERRLSRKEDVRRSSSDKRKEDRRSLSPEKRSSERRFTRPVRPRLNYNDPNVEVKGRGRFVNRGITNLSPDGSITHPYFVGIAGGSGSGKTSVAERVLKNLNVPWVVILSMDSFYNILTPEQSLLAKQNLYNFDHPNAVDYDLLYKTLKKLKEGKSVTVPIYNFVTHTREEKTTIVYGANVILFEGVLALYDKLIRDMMDVKIFVDTDSDIQLARRMQRDVAYRGRTIEYVLDQYIKYVKPAYENYIRPSMKFADIIITRGLENVVAIDLVTKHIQTQLNENTINLRWRLLDTPVNEQILQQVNVLNETNQVKLIHTILRDHTTKRDEFVFYANRLSVLLMEYTVSLLPYESLTICGVSILRAGGTLEIGLKRVFHDAILGTLLIQTNPNTGDPELHYCKLPNDLRDHHIILMDALVGTGAAALMAIRVLLDHEVLEDQIIFVSFISTKIGLTVINNAFPNVQLVTSMIDPGLNKENAWIQPGIGNFGDRYFGTEEEEYE